MDLSAIVKLAHPSKERCATQERSARCPNKKVPSHQFVERRFAQIAGESPQFSHLTLGETQSRQFTGPPVLFVSAPV